MMSISHRRVRAFAVATVPFGFALAVAATPVTMTAQALPSPQQLTARYVQAIGGRNALLKPQASRAIGTFEMAAAGLKGELVIVTQAPNRMVLKVTIPGTAEMLSGYDGQIGWSDEPMSGARLLSGGELHAMRENANVLAAVRDSSLFRSMQTVERTEMAGEPCFRVKLVWRSGRESYDCYHVDTGLLIATTTQAETPTGTVAVTTRLTEYGKFGDVMIPTRMILEMMGVQQVLTISTMEYENVNTSMIDPPAQIRALVQSGK